jgi:hypothetical protein
MGGSILGVLITWLTLWASAGELDDLASRALAELQAGRMQQAYDLTRASYTADPAVAAVHLAAAQRVAHPLQVSEICRQIVPRALESWSPAPDVLRTCGWQLYETRAGIALAAVAAGRLVQMDPFDDNARGLKQLLVTTPDLPRRKWDPPKTRVPGQMRQRRKRDLVYLWEYLRPEDGEVGVFGGVTFLPEGTGVPSQIREGVRARLDLRPHEIVPAGYRVTHALPREGPAVDRATTHQLYGGYRLLIWRKNPLQLDATAILGKGRDEAAVRFRTERVGLGVWSAETAAVVSPWGTHAALGLGWSVFVEGLAQIDLRVEGQAGQGSPRGLVRLGLQRRVGGVSLRLDGQAGQAVRPLGDTLLIRDLPGLEGLGGDLSLDGWLSKHLGAAAGVGVRRLHPEPGAPGATAGLVRLEIKGAW